MGTTLALSHGTDNLVVGQLKDSPIPLSRRSGTPMTRFLVESGLRQACLGLAGRRRKARWNRDTTFEGARSESK